MKDPPDRITQTTEQDLEAQAKGGKRGTISVFTCPECGGALWQSDDQKLLRFRCHVGHSYVGEALLAEKSEALEGALWTALRMFKEKAVLSRQMATQARQEGNDVRAERFDEDAQVAERNGEAIHECLSQGQPGSYGSPEDKKS